MSRIRILSILLCLYFFSQAVQAQNSLEPVDDTASTISGILSGNKKGVSSVRVASNTEQSVTLEIDHKGFEGKYKVKGTILNKLKKPMADFISEEKTLSKPDGTQELKFQFKEGKGSYTNTSLETHYVSITFIKTDGILGSIDLGSDNVLGETYIFKLSKVWRLSGNENMVITVKLTPYKSASTIKP